MVANPSFFILKIIMNSDTQKSIIVFLDIDGTLLDIRQACNSETLFHSIHTLKDAGVRFGLNSNRAKEDVISIIQQFGLDGPFILENGAVIYEHLDQNPFFADGLENGIPEKVKEALQEVVAREFPSAQCSVTDTVKMIQENAGGNGFHFFMNSHRKYSASIHHRKDGNTQRAIAEQLAHALNEFFLSKSWHLIARAHAHGETVTVEIPGVTKGTGLHLLRRHHPLSHVIAIGDGWGEVDLRDAVDALFAVSNAIEPLKQIADAVSSLPMAQGVEELLEKKVRPLVSTKKAAQ